jgi:hypothetical protein
MEARKLGIPMADEESERPVPPFLLIGAHDHRIYAVSWRPERWNIAR